MHVPMFMSKQNPKKNPVRQLPYRVINRMDVATIIAMLHGAAAAALVAVRT